MPAARVTLVCTTVLGAAQRARIDVAVYILDWSAMPSATDDCVPTRTRARTHADGWRRSTRLLVVVVRLSVRTYAIHAAPRQAQPAGPARGARRPQTV
jgi:hypothetical protein